MIIVSQDVQERFPLQYSAVFGPVETGSGGNPEVVSSLRQFCHGRREAWSETLPAGVQHWRNLFDAMGVRKGKRPSVDALFRRFMRTGDLPEISPVVDLYNWISLATGTPMAAYDAGFVDAFLELRYARGGEPFEPMGAPSTNDPTVAGEVVYADSAGVVCRHWNWLDSHRSRIRDETRTVLFVADLTANARERADEAAREIASHLSTALGTTVASSTYPQIGE
jgi:DNA/RNA-binding domain of Phe-tRNA-synthetase-like protein